MSSRRLQDVSGAEVHVPDPSRLVHLQFRRFAGCPVCNLHLRSIVKRHAEIEAAGIREVVVFHSSAADLREHVAGLPFAVIPDPTKRLYREFGVESSRRSLLHPRVWPHIAAAVARSVWSLLRGRGRAPSLTPAGGRWGLPADFLINPDGTLRASRYGEHAYDQWTVDDLLQLAR
ncbi:peroxiredoxin-like family protein [Dactylosporangium sucinum]|uniref:peroxiredoxin-like family protein n=1 Tax=Dactylosporangium sucinum TaxID=1424081 RepID=UPI001E297BF7|nr:peroxiredoxin-like family protein [Dactylosporangium sucinum]